MWSHLDTFVGNSQGQDPFQEPPSSPSASRASLLDRSELNVLDTFFDNPNNIDPSFLAVSREQSNPDPYGAASNPWMFGAMQQEPASHMPQPQHRASPVLPFGTQQDTPEDVYNAARLLHSHQATYSDGPFGAQGFIGTPSAPQAQMYGYGLGQAPQSTYHSSSSTQTSPMTQSVYGPLMSSHSTIAQRPSPLNFGSDNKFGHSEYVAPSMPKPPDQELMSILSTLSHDPGQSPAQIRVLSPSELPKRKKRRLSQTSDDDDNDDNDDNDEGATSQKRGKQRVKSEEGSEDDSASTPRGKHKRHSGGSQVFSPGRRRRSSPGSRKPGRENLTEEQKRNNHIQSEQKRRNLIKMGFEDTNRMVPELRAGGFSKSNMLLEAAKFMRELKEGNEQLSDILGVIDKG